MIYFCLLLAVITTASGQDEDKKEYIPLPPQVPHNIWAAPGFPTDYPVLDVGHYPEIEGHGNCMKCLSLSKKSLYALGDPDCRVVPFKDAPIGKKNLVQMAKAGGCYQDNPANFISLIGLYKLLCKGFVINYHQCTETCPFDGPVEVTKDKNYQVFPDSRCQFKITEPMAKLQNFYILKSDDIIIHHSFEEFNEGNSERTSTRFQNSKLSDDKIIQDGSYLFVINTANTPKSFNLT